MSIDSNLRRRGQRNSSWRIIALPALVVALLAGAFVSRAAADSPPTFFNGFETDTSGWHVFEPFGSQYVPTRVASGTDGVTSKTGNWHAEAQGPLDLDMDGGSAATDWGGYGFSFPTGGYTTSIDIYLDMGTSASNDTRFDFSSATSAPGPGTCSVTSSTACSQDSDCPVNEFCKPPFDRDFVFNAGFYNDSDSTGTGPRFVISASNNAGRSGAFPKNPGRSPYSITTTGWYTFKHRFYDNGSGVLAVDLSIVDSSNHTLMTWTLSDPSDVIGSTVGDHRYGWFAAQEFPFLAFDNSQRSVTCLGTRFVATTGSDSSNTCANSSTPCLTIQHAVDVACDGETVSVAAGTYDESPQVLKSLTIQSASGKAVTTIALQTGPTYLGSLEVGGQTVTIDGFTIVGRDGTPSTIAASDVFLDGGLSSVTLRNNTFRIGQSDPTSTDGDDGFGVLTTYHDSGVNVTTLDVENNLFEPLNSVGTRAFYINPGVGTFTFMGNSVTGNFAGTGITQAANGQVSNNTVDGQGLGGVGLGTWGYPDADVWGHTTFQNNVFTGLARGIGIFETNDVVISCNRFSSNATGVEIEDGFGTVNFDPTTIDIHSNSFLGNTTDGVANSATTTGAVQAKNDWWGCAAGPGHPGCDSVAGSVTFTPVATSPPACVSCAQNSDCDDGLVCDGTETCNLTSHMCQAGTPPTCTTGSADPQCNVASCQEPTGCVVNQKPNSTACNAGLGDTCTIPDTCQSGVCTAGGGGDPDHDLICSADDNCPTIYNPDQKDVDHNGVGDACTLNLTLVNLRRSSNATHPNGRIAVKGSFLSNPPHDVFSRSAGFTVIVKDNHDLVETFSFTPAECTTASGGIIKCANGINKANKLVFRPSHAAPAQFTFSLVFQRLSISPPFLPPATVSLTQGTPGTAPERTGTISACGVVTPSGMICRQG